MSPLADPRRCLRGLRSLRVRLLGTLGLSVLLALVGAAVLVRGTTESEFERYVGTSRLDEGEQDGKPERAQEADAQAAQAAQAAQVVAGVSERGHVAPRSTCSRLPGR